MVAQMVDEFTVAVTMTPAEAERHAQRAAIVSEPHVRIWQTTHYNNNVAQGYDRQVPLSDVRVRFEWDDTADLDYIERFDSADEYNEWCEREGALNTKFRFVSMRPETRQFDGLRFETLTTSQLRGDVARGRWNVGGYYIVRFATDWNHKLGRDDRDGAVRLALKSEIHMDYDEYMSTKGDRNNYWSFGAILEVYDATSREWELIDSIWGCDFYIGPGSRESTPDTDHAYTLSDLKHESFNWIVSEHFGIDFSTIPD